MQAMDDGSGESDAKHFTRETRLFIAPPPIAHLEAVDSPKSGRFDRHEWSRSSIMLQLTRT